MASEGNPSVETHSDTHRGKISSLHLRLRTSSQGLTGLSVRSSRDNKFSMISSLSSLARMETICLWLRPVRADRPSERAIEALQITGKIIKILQNYRKYLQALHEVVGVARQGLNPL